MSKISNFLETVKAEFAGYWGRVKARHPVKFPAGNVAYKGMLADGHTMVDRQNRASVHDSDYGSKLYKSEKEMLKDWEWVSKEEATF